LWKKEWDYLAAWLNDQNLIIGTTPESDKTSGRMSSTFIVFNPFTGESQILKPDYPNIYKNYLIAASWVGWRETVYNQDLDRVVYLQTEPDGIEFANLVLWDMDQQHSLASFGVFGDPHSIPRWAPDGSKFAFATSININNWPAYELRSVNRDGQVNQLTNLTTYYPWVYIADFSWSPDSSYIAFWFSWWVEEKPGYDFAAKRYLAIVDTKNNKTTNYCIEGKPSDSGRMPPPIWSPDGNQLIVESFRSDGHSQVVLIDLANQVAVQIGEDMTPEGWMVKP